MKRNLHEALDLSYEVERVLRWAFARICHQDAKTAETMSRALKNLTLMQDRIREAIHIKAVE